MSPLHKLISETPGCSIVPWVFDPSLRKIPKGCPDDLAEAARTIYKAHIHETPVAKGTQVTQGSFTFDPCFEHTVAAAQFLHQEEYEDPATMAFTKCYSLGCFGWGNNQLILDLSDEQEPKLRHFYYYPVDPLASYALVPMTFDAFIRTCIEAGPEVEFLEKYVYGRL